MSRCRQAADTHRRGLSLTRRLTDRRERTKPWLNQAHISSKGRKSLCGRAAGLGPYEIVELLGTGGMGEVYRAHDSRLGRDVALKILRHSSADPDSVARFSREARAAGSLNHPNIVAVFDVGTAGGVPYVVTELLEGETLRARLDRGRSPTARLSNTASRSRRHSTPRTARASGTATSSRRTCSSPPTGA